MAKPLTSIQGEAQVEKAPVLAEMEDVDLYLDNVSDKVVECRERGRHLYESSRTSLVFVDVTSDDLFVRIRKCRCCELAARRELWQAVQVPGRRGEYRYELVVATTTYSVSATGENYAAPSGQGRITARMVAKSLVSKAFHNVSKAEMKRRIRTAQK